MSSTVIPKTRHGGRNKRFTTTNRKVDHNKRRAVIQQKLRFLEEDFFEDPNKMAEFDDEDVFEVDGEPKKRKNQKRVNKRAKKQGHLKRNLNLRKIIQQQGLQEKKEPNFCHIKVEKPRYPARKYCSICGNLSRSSCPRCGERICQLRCFKIHSEIKCLNFEMQY